MKKSQILIYYSGSLGDILALIPVFGAIRNAHIGAEITLLNIQDGGKKFAPGEILKQGGFVDRIRVLHHRQVKVLRALRFLLPLVRFRLPQYEVIYYCGRDGSGLKKRILRDRKLLKVLAPKAVIRGDVQLRSFSNPLEELPRVGELLLERINAAQGMSPLTAAPNDLHLTAAEKEKAGHFFDSLKIPEGKIPLAVGMGGKQPVCRYPVENYFAVLKPLTEENGVFSVFFGGTADYDVITGMLERFGAGKAGRADMAQLSLRETIALLGFFRFYIGNDTGTLHMAAAAQLPCIGVCSSHDNPGLWKPLGEQHIILRCNPECTGCRKNICPKQMPPPCLAAISPEMVLTAARSLLNR